MNKKILFKTIIAICLFLNLCLVLSMNVYATKLIEEERLLDNIQEIANNTIVSDNNIEMDSKVKDVIDNSETFFIYINNSEISESVNIPKALDMLDTCDEEINKRVKKYQEEQERIAIAAEMKRRGGMVGRLIIPDVDVNVAVIRASIYNGERNQAVVDARDSAAWMTDWGAAILIADHNNQGFEKMKGAVVGETIAYIKDGSTVKKYICTANFKGHNTGSTLTDNNYRNVENDNSGGLTMYTCNENWRNITITYWQPI